MRANWKQKYDELFRMTESYIKQLHDAEEENKRLREALQMISNGIENGSMHKSI